MFSIRKGSQTEAGFGLLGVVGASQGGPPGPREGVRVCLRACARARARACFALAFGSFNRLCHHVVGYRGPTLLLFRDRLGRVAGLLSRTDWRDVPTFQARGTLF